MSDEHDFFTSLRDRAPERLRTDGDALVEVAETGPLPRGARRLDARRGRARCCSCWRRPAAARCSTSTACRGPPGSARSAGCGPSRASASCSRATPEHADAARAVFTERGLACEVCGEFEDSRRLDLQSGAERATVWDFDIAPLTGLGGARA